MVGVVSAPEAMSGVGIDYPLGQSLRGDVGGWTHDELPVSGQRAISNQPLRMRTQASREDGQQRTVVQNADE
jgi:hypothetical protein